MNIRPLPIAIGYCAWLCAGCFDGGGTASPALPAALSGRLVDPSGRPAAGARVWVVRDARVPLAKAADPAAEAPPEARIALADGEGRFAIPGLAAGEYGLQAESADSRYTLFKPGIMVDSVAGTGLGADTLRIPGRIVGAVVTWYPDRGGALCGIPGSGLLAATDSDGAFALTGVPAGRYALVYRLPGFAPGHSSPLDVPAGGTAVAPPETLAPEPETPPPPPQGLSAAYDSVRGTVTLKWRKPAFPGALGFYLSARAFRAPDYADATAPLISGMWGDTEFTDTLLRYVLPDGESARYPGSGAVSGPAPFTVAYTLSIATGGSPQGGGEARVEVASDTRPWSHPRAASIRVLEDRVRYGDTAHIEVTYSDSLFPASGVSWNLATGGGGGGIGPFHAHRSRAFADVWALPIDTMWVPGDSLMAQAEVMVADDPFRSGGRWDRDPRLRVTLKLLPGPNGRPQPPGRPIP